MKTKIATIGLGQIGSFQNFILQSEESMGEFRMLAWKPSPKDAYWQWAARQADFAQFFDRGGSMLLLLERGGEFRYALPPDFPIFAQKLTGFALETVDGQIGKLLAPYFNCKPKYSVVINVTKGTFKPIAYTPGNRKNIALWTQYRNGFICVLPFDKDKQDFLSKAITRVDGFFSKQIKSSSLSLGQLPSWVKKYRFVEEQRALFAKKDLEQQLAKIQKELPLLDEVVKSFDRYMYLFSEEGKSLEGLVRSSFSELGLSVEDGPDLNSYGVVKYQNHTGILLTKATEGSVADKEARQVEAWKIHYEGYSEQLPKGILVVNTFMGIDIIERRNDHFSNELISYTEATEICVISTIQLVGLLMELKTHSHNRSRIIEIIFGTNGPLKGYQEPLKYLVPIDQAAG